MSCFPCFKPLPVAGAEDEPHADSYEIRMALTTGQEVPVLVRPSDSMALIRRKVESVHGRQPDVARADANGFQQLVRCHIVVQDGRKWVSVNDNVTLAQLDMRPIRFAKITDQLRAIENFRNAHWLGSNIVNADSCL